MRVFFVVLRPMPDEPCGGGGGVNYRLMKAQEKYHLFEDVYFVFSNCMVADRTGEKVDLLPVEQLEYVDKQKTVYSLLNKYLKFNDDDCFVFHDLHSFRYMSEVVGAIKKSIIVYHQQGGLYYESIAYGAPENAERKGELDSLTEYAIKNSTIFAFPSLGAKEALLNTLPESRTWFGKREDVILYNGCTPRLKSERDVDFEEIELFLKKIQGSIFASVAVLNDAKGVERLPQFFFEIWQKYIKRLVLGSHRRWGKR